MAQVVKQFKQKWRDGEIKLISWIPVNSEDEDPIQDVIDYLTDRYVYRRLYRARNGRTKYFFGKIIDYVDMCELEQDIIFDYCQPCRDNRPCTREFCLTYLIHECDYL